MLQFASVSFDSSVLDIAAVLASGGTLVIATAAERAEPSRLTALLRASGVQVASVVPSLLELLDPGPAAPVTARLRSGAERLTARLARAWAPGRRLVNSYGPTETTVVVTAGDVDQASDAAPPIGVPIAARPTSSTRGWPRSRRGDRRTAHRRRPGHPRVREPPSPEPERFVANPFAADGSRLLDRGPLDPRRAAGVHPAGPTTR